MNRFYGYDVKLVHYSTFNELIYDGSVIAKVDKRGKIVHINHNKLLESDVGRVILRMLRKGNIDQY